MGKEKGVEILMSDEFVKQSGYMFLSAVDVFKKIADEEETVDGFINGAGRLSLKIVETFDEICENLADFTEEEMNDSAKVKKVFSEVIGSKSSKAKTKSKENIESIDKKIEILKEIKDVMTRLEAMIWLLY